MDLSTFYALFSATCFTLLGLWWNVAQARPAWVADPHERRTVGGVYLAFLLPGLMGLFAQVGGTDTPEVWRVSFVVTALVGVVATTRILTALRSTDRPTGKHLTAVVLYLLVAVVGVMPDVGSAFDLTSIQVEALLLIGLVLVGHGLVWEFFVAGDARFERPASS